MAFIDGLAGCKISSALDYSSASTALAGTALDMSGYQGVLMVVKMAAITTGAATSIKAQCDDNSGFSSAQDIAGTAITIADDDDNQIFVLDVRNVPERYVRVYLDRATQAAAASAVYIQYGPDSNPQVNDVTDKVTTETHIWKAVGTA
jgi:hypothetical protein